MKKLALDIDALGIETFEPVEAAPLAASFDTLRVCYTWTCPNTE